MPNPFRRRRPAAVPDELDSRLLDLEQRLADLPQMQADYELLLALAPRWLVDCIPHARALGWTVSRTDRGLTFRHVERDDEYTVATPLPDQAGQRAVAAELSVRLGFSALTGLSTGAPVGDALTLELLEGRRRTFGDLQDESAWRLNGTDAR